MNEEKYLNQISLMKQALEFYGNTNNYISGMCNPTMIDNDKCGSQARFALKQLDIIEEENKKIIHEYKEYTTESSDELNNIINTFKNISDGNY